MAATDDVIGFLCRVGSSVQRRQPRSTNWAVLSALLVAALRVSTASEYCQLEIFEASCPDGSVILMQRALYGRMRIGRCLTRDYFVGCAADVIVELDAKCSGRQQCRVQVPDHSLLRALACPSDLVSYLEAEYTCITGETTVPGQCSTVGHVTTSGTSGYLLSELTQSTGVGSDRCPWLIVAQPGQNIRITLFDVQPPAGNQRQRLGAFGTNTSALSISGGANGPGINSGAGGGTNAAVGDNRCVLYATIKDSEYHPEMDQLRLDSTGSEHVVCSGGGGGAQPVVGGGIGARQTAVYTMQSHSVTVTVYHTPGARFILKYEAVGCADPVLPVTSSAQIFRRGDQVDIVCNYSGSSAQRRQQQQLQQLQQQASSVHSWHLVCHQTQWIGDFGNCTSNGVGSASWIESASADDEHHQQTLSLSYGLWFAVAAGLFLGITIGCSLLLFVCLKRQTSDNKDLPTTVVSNNLPVKYAPYRSYQFDASDCGDDANSGCDVIATSKLPPPPPRRAYPPPSCAIYAYRVDQDVGVVGLQTGNAATTCVHHYAHHCMCHEAEPTITSQTMVLQ